MTRSLLSLACHLYGAAAIAYLAYLVRQRPGIALTGRVLVAAGIFAHAGSIGTQILRQGGLPSGVGQGLSLFSFLLLLIFLGIDLVYRRPVIGSFVTPFAVAILVPAFLVDSAIPIPDGVRRPLLPFHVSIAMLGLATFAAATGIALMYLLMERQVKQKKFGLLFSRLPPLQVLDDLNRRLVTFGFVALSFTLATGALFASSAGGFMWMADPKTLATAVAWVVFAAVLNARFFGGWRGKRVAMMTMAGFCLLLVSFFSSYTPMIELAGGSP